jgi:adenylosuccinate lyase
MASYDPTKVYVGPATWRNGSPEMLALWSDGENRREWRQTWYGLAEAQYEQSKGQLITKGQLDVIAQHVDHVDIEAAHAIEAKGGHDLMAELEVYRQQCGEAGGRLHLGATTMDIEDNAIMRQMLQATRIVKGRAGRALRHARKHILDYRLQASQAWTHIQPATITTWGYRLATHAQDLMVGLSELEAAETMMKGKGFKGAVGTQDSYTSLLGPTGALEMENLAMKKLGLEAWPVSTQIYPRVVDHAVLSALGTITSASHKFGQDMRIMQSPAFGEVSEPRKEGQVGSSAMPWKINPAKCERMCGLSRLIPGYATVAWINSAVNILERTIDDSASRRVIIPEGFIYTDAVLVLYGDMTQGMQLHKEIISRNLRTYNRFAGTERVLMAAAKAGGNRQDLHARIKGHAMAAWDDVRKGEPPSLLERMQNDAELTRWVPAEQMTELVDTVGYGRAAEMAESFVMGHLDPLLARYEEFKLPETAAKF